MNKKNIENIYPLSPTQQGILFHTLHAPESGVYVVQSCYPFSQTLDIAAFQQAWQQVINRHPILRTSFHWQQYKEPFQVVHKSVTIPWQYYDWQNSSEIEQQLAAFLQADCKQGFDLTHPPLLRLTLIQIAENTYHFVWSSHHLILDGWSTALVLQQVFLSYAGISDRSCATRPYADYINWLQQQDLSQAETFWRKTLQGFTAPTPLKLGKSTGYSNHSLKLSAATTAALQSIARQHRLTLNTLLQGAWAILLARYSGEEDIVFGATSSGRPPTLVGSESMVGLFINTLPVRVQVSGKALLIPWLQQLQARQVEAQQYEYSPLVQVQAWSDVPRDVPLFESILVFENYPVDAGLQQWATEMQVHQIQSVESTNYAIALKAGVSNELSLEILSDRPSTPIQRMLGHLQTLLEGMVANPQSAIASLPLLTTAEQQQLLEWNNTQTDYPQDKCIQQLFENQAAQTPDAIAVVFADQYLTYQQLNSRANQLTHYLQKLNVGLEVPVAICLERSLEMVIGILAILKAGGAYVPIDPAYPQERLTAILAEVHAPVFLTQKRLLTKLAPINTKVVCLDADWQNIHLESEKNLLVAVTPDNLAYIMYTSGSTGTPKGVSVLHKGVVRLVKATNYAQLNAQEVFLQAAPISFDAATFEIWGCLLNGAKLVLFPNDTASLLKLGQVIRQHQITTLWLTASLFHLIVDEQLEDLQTVKQILAGGDVLSVPHVQKLLQSKHCQLINGYGPTENTTFSCCYPVTDDHYLENIPIGRAIANTQVYILDPCLQLLPIGISGEIYVGGDGLARHYHRRPELTASSFIPHPFSKTPGARLYKTGDLGRYREDGNIEFLGRSDRQVKVRGFRIELGEIEGAISQYPQVKQAVVTANKDQLVAYVVLAPSLIDDLRGFLQSKLPKYMLPSVFIPLTALPINVNGKVDRQLLPAPQAHTTQLKTYISPRTTQEAQLAHIWAEILGLERVGIHDDFFALGGHSLAIVRLFARIRQTFAVDIPIQTIFTAPTIAEFAQRLLSDPPTSPVFDLQSEAVLDLEITCSKKYIPISEPASIFLTGATGFLGAFLLAELLQQTSANIYCLVRATNAEAARHKIQDSFTFYSLNDVGQSSRIIPVVGDLSQPLLGLSEAQFTALAEKIDVIYHNGAWVHHASPYSILKAANVLGTQEILRLASQIKIKPVHFISTISVFSAAGEAGLKVVSEDSSLDEIPFPEGGYAQSKWVAEKLIKIAGDRGLPISIYRPGRISGHSQTGAFNPNDLLSRLLVGCLNLGSFPEGEFLEGLAPVDYVSKAIVSLSQQPASLGKAFHLLNPQPFELKMLFKVIRSFGYPLKQISSDSWQAELALIGDRSPEHPLYPLIPLLHAHKKSPPITLNVDCKNTLQSLNNSSIICPSTDEKLLSLYLSRIIRNNLESLPQKDIIHQ
ncbi:non-ribosomal peptide synthetase [Chlorogloea sp. CCALA 695]|uniref:non-ribosomal peptide synthetase n=1 Tax=Chlorogloea sp. CCALA 695 TaxID=2107693 RepID=UPI000D055866|nr:non-ribosomal peptide synthetase [Chlorogloea sp. CCALA 695]PSB30557.1 non-ribosomal peptide synthetase [Chlorogloea sp. CCALA 695]